ncbi:MAG: DUF4115 domain-containing protein [Porphyrobacter sp.]|nr:DUF4115 domain-containing protein [Porphyrobacter sp.]
MDSEQDISVEPAQDTAYSGAGARLRAAREARRLDLAHIAAESRIPQRHLEAIEAGDFGALPSRTYAIGFSRTYAKLLGLDDGAITDAVRGELSEGGDRRATTGSGMEPGDPAKLPSASLAWFGAFAALVLAVGMIAFFSARFGAGTGPAPLEAPPQVAEAPVPVAPAVATPAADAEVVLTAMDDGVWVRIFEEGGERLLEKQMAKGESFTVPADAEDPRINTGRPDLLAITVGGKSVPRLAERPTTLAGMAISAEALLSRPGPENEAAPGADGLADGAVRRGTVQRRTATPAPTPAVEPVSISPAETAAPAASETVPEPGARPAALD